MSRPAAATLLAAAGVRLNISPPRAAVEFDTVAAPDENAFAAALAETGRHLTGDVRVIVVSAATWCPPVPPVPPRALPTVTAPVAGWLSAQADLFSIAVLHGTVAGFGLSVALACDLRVGADDTQLTWTGVGTNAGAGASGGSSASFSSDGIPGADATALVAAVGFARALEWSVLGATLAADRAADLGLLSRVVPAADVGTATEDLVEALLAVPRERAVETKARLLRTRHTYRPSS